MRHGAVAKAKGLWYDCGMVKTRQPLELSDAQEARLRELVREFGLTLVVLFGSQATGHAGRESDVDVAFRADHELVGDEDVRLNYECTNLFGTDRVDTANLRYASALLLQQVADQGIPLYEKTGI